MFSKKGNYFIYLLLQKALSTSSFISRNRPYCVKRERLSCSAIYQSKYANRNKLKPRVIALFSGELILSLEAYLIRDWYSLQLVVHAPILILLGLYFIIPESTRWLLAKGHSENARKDLFKRASINSVSPIPDEVFQYTEITDTNEIKTKRFGLRDLFRPKVILIRSVVMFYQWFSVTMVYYGLLFTSTSFSGDPHLNLTLVVLAELPSVLLYLKLPNMFGRRNILVTAQLVAGICCILGMF